MVENSREGGRTVGSDVIIPRASIQLFGWTEGILRIKIHITGKPSHAGIDYFAGVSAIREAAYKIIELETKSEEGATTYNCGIACR